MITQEYLKSILRYEPDTGNFIRLKSKGKIYKIGDIAGCVTNRGYVTICINGKVYYGHRLAWFYMTGRFIDQIDHKDLNKSNNKWENLRESSGSQNLGNIRKHKDNKSGYKGVSWYKPYQKWVVYIKAGSLRKNLGYYDDILEAAKVYEKAAEKYFKEFARTE